MDNKFDYTAKELKIEKSFKVGEQAENSYPALDSLADNGKREEMKSNNSDISKLETTSIKSKEQININQSTSFSKRSFDSAITEPNSKVGIKPSDLSLPPNEVIAPTKTKRTDYKGELKLESDSIEDSDFDSNNKSMETRDTQQTGSEDSDYYLSNDDEIVPKNPFIEHGKSAEEFALKHFDNRPKKYYRYLISEIKYANENGKPEQRLILFDLVANLQFTAILRDDWATSPVKVGAIVHIIGKMDFVSRSFVIDKSEGYLVLNPDTLISTTALVDGLNCNRRAVLKQRVRGAPGNDSSVMVFGILLHELMQLCLTNNCFEQRYMEKVAEQLVKRNYELLYGCQESDLAAVEFLRQGIKPLQDWATAYITQPDPNHTNKHALTLTKLLKVEENIWSPMFGLKGKIDAALEVVDRSNPDETLTLLVPLEFKSGKAGQNSYHRAQILLYLLMMEERYETPIQTGWLFYVNGDVKENMMIKVTPSRNELLSLLHSRNLLTTHLVASESNDKGINLPAMLRNPGSCKYCATVSACTLYHKAFEGGDSLSSGIPELFEKSTLHLSQRHLKFFKEFELAMNLEEVETGEGPTLIWEHNSFKEKHNNFLLQLQCVEEIRVEADEAPQLLTNEFVTDIEDIVKADFRSILRTYRFTRPSLPNIPLTKSNLNEGDVVLISTDNRSQSHQHIALTYASIVNLTDTYIDLLMDRPFTGTYQKALDFVADRHHSFDQAYPELQIFNRNNTVGRDCVPDNNLYRLDSVEYSGTNLQTRANLVDLLTSDQKIPVRLRALIVDLDQPIFGPTCSDQQNSSQVTELLKDLNSDQKEAIQKVMAARDYALVLGMPGTGKTTLIANLIKTLTLHKGTRILITSHTHSAVDTILRKLDSLGITSIVRLGSKEKVHPDVHKFLIKSHFEGRPTSHGLDQLFLKTSVVATTALAINHPLFHPERISKNPFQYCIVDEASQITLPICVGPLKLASRFVLVGDHYQLPPLIRGSSARHSVLGTSLFQRLSQAYPRAVATLRTQYRMNQDITDVANTLVYQGALRCGTHQVATASLTLPDPTKLEQMHSQISTHTCKLERCWLKYSLDPNHSVVLLDTDSIRVREEREHHQLVNFCEIDLTRQLLLAFEQSGIAQTRIAVISPYRHQLKRMKERLANGLSQVEVLTVDKSQGRDKDVIIFSMVRDNKQGKVGELLKDWRRINVAFTRARVKLIVIGSLTTVSAGGAVLQSLTELARERNWVFKLLANVLREHANLELNADRKVISKEGNVPEEGLV